MSKILNVIKQTLLSMLVFTLPLIFFTGTQEFYTTTKLYFALLVALLLLFLSAIKFLISQKLVWRKSALDVPIIIFSIAILIALIISSPNKIQALLNPNFSPLLVFALVVFYFYLSRESLVVKFIPLIIQLSSLLLSLTAIIVFFHPFKIVPKNFSPIGSQLDLVVFLVFSLIFSVVKTYKVYKKEQTNEKIPSSLILGFSLLGLCFALYSRFKFSNIILPPLSLSWYSAIEILKNPTTALFGIGIDNFPVIFTKVKDISYNLSGLWQINSFVVSRSAILHILTESGVLGLFGFGLIMFMALKSFLPFKENLSDPLFLQFLYLAFLLLILPPSLIVFFLLFIVLALLSNKTLDKEESIQVANMPPLHILFVFASSCFLIAAFYLTIRTYAAELSYKKTMDGFDNNNTQEIYENGKKAVLLNPYIEKYRLNFSRINILIANNIAEKIKPETNGEARQLSEQDKQIITQAIQTAISEAKAAVALNPEKAENWENLAIIYRNILNVAEGADSWTISAFQKAILADPQNPTYRLSLGGIYYSLNNFDEAAKFFGEAIVLKENWANAYYNLAWTAFKQQNYQRAVDAMQYVLNLTNPQILKDDYEKAQKDLEEFKKMLPEAEEKTVEKKSKSTPELTLPSKAPTIEPKIQLPKEASPEAKPL